MKYDYSRRATRHIVRLEEGEKRWGTPEPSQGLLPENWGGNEPNHTVACLGLKATPYDRRHLAPCHDEFRGPRSGLCRLGGISNNSNYV
ncbi:uncharacterized protein TNCV_3419981 [Trichonephila clavipes]|nr:uncharacterized protein TNCV_3419981 [Trichonephila clavipes]